MLTRNVFYETRPVILLLSRRTKILLTEKFYRRLKKEKRKYLSDQGPSHDVRVILNQIREQLRELCVNYIDLLRDFRKISLKYGFHTKIMFINKKTIFCRPSSVVLITQPAG